MGRQETGEAAAENDLILLNNIIQSKRDDYPDKNDSEFFHFFVAQQILREHNRGDDDVELGLVDSGNDGGVDGFYLLVNGDLDQEDVTYDHLRSSIVIDLLIIQATRHRGFKEAAVEHFITSSMDIFKLSEANLSTSAYNEQLLGTIKRFHSVYTDLVPRRAALNVRFYYASKGNRPSAGVNLKANKLKETVLRFMPDAKVYCKFLGANELYKLTMETPPLSLTLKTIEMPISSRRGGFVCLVSLPEFFNFVIDNNGVLRAQLFEANVRDYQGRVEVNTAIQTSLNTPSEDFWWLNNGVSIVATGTTPNYKALTIHDPQIVNGLQTTREIYGYFNKTHNEADSEDRCVLVRVITPAEVESRNRIIKATNSQTVVPISSLRSTDDIHKEIELHLKTKGLFYDRRKSYYKNADKPRSKIVGISKLAQAVMAIVLRRPDLARARPSTLLKNDDEYSKLFNRTHPLDLYYVCAEGVRKIESSLRSLDPSIVSKHDRQNLKFYVAMHAIAGIDTAPPKPEKIARFDVSSLDEAMVNQSLNFLLPKYRELGADDNVAKSTKLLKAILDTE